MQTIQVPEAEADLSRMLEQVEQGGTIEITRDGRTIACVTPGHEPGEWTALDQERARWAMEGIRELRKRIKPSTLEEILSARDEGRR